MVSKEHMSRDKNSETVDDNIGTNGIPIHLKTANPMPIYGL